MATIGLFFGSDTGNTEAISKTIQKKLGKKLVDVKDIAKSAKEDIAAFDLIILGMGEDGHTASLFPESDLLHEKNKLVGSCYHKESNTERISFTFPLINAAKNVYVITLGSGKYEILQNIKQYEQNNEVFYPIQQVKPQGNLLWYLDKAAELGA